MQEADESLIRTVTFHSKQAKKDFYGIPPRDVIISFITQLESRLAVGLSPTIPITHLGDGVIELKVNGSPAYRCVYTMKQPGKVVVLHTFAKTTNGPDVPNVRLAKQRAKKHK
nr:type II toxin-antitoxin system RelE/ParE family toxin [Delftia acidovorans]